MSILRASASNSFVRDSNFSGTPVIQLDLLLVSPGVVRVELADTGAYIAVLPQLEQSAACAII